MIQELYELQDNSPEYCSIQGQLYDHLSRDIRASEPKAMDVARKLNNGDVAKAEELVHEILGE